MLFVIVSATIALGLFLGMMLFLEIGWRRGAKHMAESDRAAQAGVGVVEGAVYGLLALLIGFMFSGAAGRFDERRQTVAQEQDAASTVWQRISLLPADQQVIVRAKERHYIDELIAYYRESSPTGFVLLEQPPALRRAESDLWGSAAAATMTPGGDRARMLLLPALNELFDAVDNERMARRIHPPAVIFLMLGVAALATALFAGYGMASGGKRNWMYTVGIAATISVSVYVIIELEYPRVGLFRVNAFDQVLAEFRASME